jgi:hypothetical protein
MRWLALLWLVVPLFANAEVCRFRAGDGDDPFRRWLTSQEVVCVASHTTGELPAGLWNVFTRTAEGVSLPTLGEGWTVPLTPVVPSATLVLRLPDQHRGVVYVPQRASAYPVDPTQRVMVPAGESLWVMVLDKGNAVASIVAVPALDAGSERAVDARTGALPPSILGWLQVAEAERIAVQRATGIASPTVRVAAIDADPLPPPAALHGAFVLARGVAAGEVEMDIGGRSWLPYRMKVNVGSRAVTTASGPLLVRPASSLLVNWSLDDRMKTLEQSFGSCNGGREGPRQIEISILACAKPKREIGPLDPKKCTLVRRETIAAILPFGSFAVDEVAPGAYRAEMRFGKLPVISAETVAPPLQQQTLPLSGWFEAMYGSLTIGGEPLADDATIEIAGGGVGFASKETGEYRAVVRDGVEVDQKIDVVTCDGKLRAFVLADEDSEWRTRFDIDIPDNEIAVNVTDTFTQMPLPNATLRYVVMSKRKLRPVVTRTITGNDESNGSFTIRHVPEREIRLTVSHAGYQKSEIAPFTMTRRGDKHLDVQLLPLRGSRGKVLSPKPFDGGTILWMSPAGNETERAELAPDGTFVFTNTHEAGEVMAVVSFSHPLWVVRTPKMGEERQTFEIPFPVAPVREFDVEIRSREIGPATYIGIVIGGVPVPQAALRTHQMLRELEPLVFVGSSTTYRDILETGPIEVLRGPTVNQVPSRGRGFDPLILPQSADVPRQWLLAGVGEIVFE